jgi:thymidylate kinase
MNRIASHNVIPHHAFLLQRPQELIDNDENNSMDLFETESDKFKQRVKEGYYSMVNNGDLTLVNVDPDVEITLNRIIDLL